MRVRRVAVANSSLHSKGCEEHARAEYKKQSHNRALVFIYRCGRINRGRGFAPQGVTATTHPPIGKLCHKSQEEGLPTLGKPRLAAAPGKARPFLGITDLWRRTGSKVVG